MNGRDLLKAMGHVEERYVDEAEYKTLRKSIPLGWISAAACLCILIGGAMIWIQPRTTSDCAAMENNAGSNIAMDAMVAETSATLARKDGENCTEDTIGLTSSPFVYLRIQAWTKEGFVGVVEETGQPDSYALESGTVLTVRVDGNTTVDICVGDNVYRWEDRMPTEADFPVGTLVAVEILSAPENGILWTPSVRAVEEGTE